MKTFQFFSTTLLFVFLSASAIAQETNTPAPKAANMPPLSDRINAVAEYLDYVDADASVSTVMADVRKKCAECANVINAYLTACPNDRTLGGIKEFTNSSDAYALAVGTGGDAEDPVYQESIKSIKCQKTTGQDLKKTKTTKKKNK